MNNKFYVLGTVLAVGALLNINNVYGYYQADTSGTVNVDIGGIKINADKNNVNIDIDNVGGNAKVNRGNIKVDTENGINVNIKNGGGDVVKLNANEAIVKLNKENLVKVLKAKVKNADKREVVIGINDKINNFNQLISQQYLENLDKMQSVLEKIALKMETAESKQEVSKAKDAIAESRTIVKEQLSKVYNISITSEKGLGVDVMKARQSLRDDIDKARVSVIYSRDAIKNAVSSITGYINSSDDVNLNTGNSVDVSAVNEKIKTNSSSAGVNIESGTKVNTSEKDVKVNVGGQ